MKPSHDLFHLIKSLSRSEKRYFKIFAGRSATDQNYLKVFAAIDKLDHYNEKALIQSLNSESLSRQFPVLKNYLYKLILKSLRNFKSDKSIDFQIKELLMNSQLLMDRGLHVQSRKQLEKASKLAKEQERYEYMAEIGAQETTLILKVKQDRLDGVTEKLTSIFEETNHYGNLLMMVESYRLISLKLLVLNRRATYIRSDQMRELYQELEKEPLLKGPPPTDSVRGAMFYHQSKAITNLATLNFEGTYHHLDTLIQVMEQNPWTIRYSPENYLYSLQNKISIAGHFLPTADIVVMLQDVRQFSERFPKITLPKHIREAMLLFGYRMELELLMREGELAQATTLVAQIRETLKTTKFKINLNDGYAIFSLYQCLVHYYLATNQLREGLHFANLIINTPEISADYQIFVDSQLLRIIILFDLKETELFESAMQNLYRFLKGHQRMHAFEKVTFDYLRKRMRLAPGTPLRPYLQELLNALIEIRDSPTERLGLRPFDVIAWLERVIQGNPERNQL